MEWLDELFWQHRGSYEALVRALEESTRGDKNHLSEKEIAWRLRFKFRISKLEWYFLQVYWNNFELPAQPKIVSEVIAALRGIRDIRDLLAERQVALDRAYLMERIESAQSYLASRPMPPRSGRRPGYLLPDVGDDSYREAPAF